jgi:hypothetical protein
MQGSHVTDGGDTGYRGIGLIGPKQPISQPLGNEIAARTQCGPGGSREVMRTGSQCQHGTPAQGNPTPKANSLWPGWENK